MKIYRIHGDNIVECERVANIIVDTLDCVEIQRKLISPSALSIELKSSFHGYCVDWNLILLPGFNKNTKRRWRGNIFSSLKDAGSFFDETPDVIISELDDFGNEKILMGIEFCSALQAGNQAWQRSARAFSIGRTGYPYLYVVDFVKYELDAITRKRKTLRFPNAAIPYSYINYSRNSNNFVAQLYIKSEEFNKSQDSTIKNFSDDNFAEQDLGDYIIKLMLGLNTVSEQEKILNKNLNVVRFLAQHANSSTNFSESEWQNLYQNPANDILNYSVENARFNFHKTIANKSHHGKSEKFVNLVDKLSVGFASKDLPFGIIPSNKREEFARKLNELYPCENERAINFIAHGKRHLIIAIFKGFKPRGDDNRPDRGLLPFVSMLSSATEDILTFVYGPIIEENFILLTKNPLELADHNGLWRSILALSNVLVIDSLILSRKQNFNISKIFDISSVKNHFINYFGNNNSPSTPAFPSLPIKFGEDDVDTGIHYLFTHILKCFEGMCNPPGGDWSGLSIIDKNYEYRWLSLPRISNTIQGKRPDHVFEIFGVFDQPLLLVIESKEKSSELEENVGNMLTNYIKSLMNFVPSVNRKISTEKNDWQWSKKILDSKNFYIISAASYLKRYAEPIEVVAEKNCEILFIMNPIISETIAEWEIEIVPLTLRSKVLKDFIMNQYNSTGDLQFIIK